MTLSLHSLPLMPSHSNHLALGGVHTAILMLRISLQAVADHLAALENDTAAAGGAANDSDEEFQLPADSDGEEEVKFGHATAKRKKNQKTGGKRKTRGMLASQERSRAGARSFETLLDQAGSRKLLDLSHGLSWRRLQIQNKMVFAAQPYICCVTT